MNPVDRPLLDIGLTRLEFLRISGKGLRIITLFFLLTIKDWFIGVKSFLIHYRVRENIWCWGQSQQRIS